MLVCQSQFLGTMYVTFKVFFECVCSKTRTGPGSMIPFNDGNLSISI